jgi:hypothetical protein
MTDSQPTARIIKQDGIVYADLWTQHGSCILSSTYDSIQDAADAITALIPGITIHCAIGIDPPSPAMVEPGNAETPSAGRDHRRHGRHPG